MRLRLLLLAAVAASVPVPAAAQPVAPVSADGIARAYDGRTGRLDVEPPRVDQAIDIDGRLDEAVWAQAAVLGGFSRYAPVDGAPADDATEVLVWYSPTAIHFGIRASALAGSVRTTLADRDHIQSDDHVIIFLSTYNDGRQAFVFGVNPLGVQLDGALSEGTRGGGGGFAGLAQGRETPDLNPDFVFQSKGRVASLRRWRPPRSPARSPAAPISPISRRWTMRRGRRAARTTRSSTSCGCSRTSAPARKRPWSTPTASTATVQTASSAPTRDSCGTTFTA